MADQKPNLREAGEKDAKARDQALQAAVKQIEQNFGQGALMKLGDLGALDVETISTGVAFASPSRMRLRQINV